MKKTGAPPKQQGYISFNLQDSGKTFLNDLLKGFEDHARTRGFKFRFLIAASRDKEIKFKFIFDSPGQIDGMPHFVKVFRDYLNMKRDSFDNLPVIPRCPGGLLSSISIINGSLYTTVSTCTMTNHRNDFYLHG